MSAGTLSRSGRARSAALPAPIDPRLQARRVEVARKQGRRRLRRLLAVAAMVVMAAAAYGISRSPLLDVDSVAVRGAEGARLDAVHDAARIERGSAMIDLDPGVVSARVAALPWVRTVDVERHWPGSVAVRVTERTPVAVAADGAGIDVEGLVIGPVPAADHLPEVDLGPAEAGTVVDPTHHDLLVVLADLPPGLRADVASGATVEGGVELTLRDGITVRVGPAERLAAKFVAVEALLEQAGRHRIAELDVRVPSSPSLTPRAGTGA